MIRSATRRAGAISSVNRQHHGNGMLRQTSRRLSHAFTKTYQAIEGGLDIVGVRRFSIEELREMKIAAKSKATFMTNTTVELDKRRDFVVWQVKHGMLYCIFMVFYAILCMRKVSEATLLACSSTA